MKEWSLAVRLIKIKSGICACAFFREVDNLLHFTTVPVIVFFERTANAMRKVPR